MEQTSDNGFQGRILVVDDVRVNVLLLEKYLSKQGYEVLSASDGLKGLEIARKKCPDIILLDIVMPKKNGYEVCEELKKYEGTKEIPIFFLSAKTEIEDKVRGLGIGAVDYITKPYNLEEVLARIRTQIKLSKTMRALEDSLKYIENDVKNAAIIQKALLPAVPFESDGMSFSWIFRPSFHVSGDIFNIIRLDNENIGIYIADVSGHGVAAAMFSVLLSQCLHVGKGGILRESDEGSITSPANVCELLNEKFSSEQFGDMYFTFFYAVLNTSTGLLRYSRAAHPFPFLFRGDGSRERLQEGGIPLGIIGSSVWNEGKAFLGKGDTLFLFSDGLIEAQQANKSSVALFEEERLEKLLVALQNKPLEYITKAVIEELIKFSGSAQFEDDVTLIAIRHNE